MSYPRTRSPVKPREGRQPEHGDRAEPGRPSPSAPALLHGLSGDPRPLTPGPLHSSPSLSLCLPISVSLSLSPRLCLSVPRLCLPVSVSPPLSLCPPVPVSVSVSPSVSLSALFLSFSTMGQRRLLLCSQSFLSSQFKF